MYRERDKNIIKEDLYREAAEIYSQYTGRKINRLDGYGYDPLVDMLIGACASEFEKVSHEIQTSWGRVLQHTAKLLIPEAAFGALPAHGILHAEAAAADISTVIDKDTVSYKSQRQQSVFFSPIGNYNLLHGGVRFLASGSSLYSIENYFEKSELGRASARQSLSPSTMWLGLEILSKHENLKEVFFYFDWARDDLQQQSEEILTASIWTIGGKKLETSLGLESNKQESLPFEEGQLIRKIEQETRLFYEHQFIRVDLSEVEGLMPTSYPDEFNAVWEPKELEVLTNPNMLWIKVSFPNAVFPTQEATQKLLDKVKIQTNCFPVLNRKMNEPHFSLNKTFNMFPLENPSGYFLGIDEVLNSRTSKVYKEKPLGGLVSERTLGKRVDHEIYSIRYRGVNRFDERDAFSVIDELIYSIREEAFVFDILGRDVVSSNLKQIRGALNEMENKMSKASLEGEASQHPTPYIAFPPGENEYVIVRYWSTLGHDGNNVPRGEFLTIHSDTSWTPDSIRLLTSTVGGRNPLLDYERIQELKSSVVIKDRILSMEDIKLYCQKILTHSAANIEVSQGIKISKNRNEGFMRTIDVHVHLAGNNDETHSQFIKRKLETELNQKSSILIPIRVFVV